MCDEDGGWRGWGVGLWMEICGNVVFFSFSLVGKLGVDDFKLKSGVNDFYCNLLRNVCNRLWLWLKGVQIQKG